MSDGSHVLLSIGWSLLCCPYELQDSLSFMMLLVNVKGVSSPSQPAPFLPWFLQICICTQNLNHSVYLSLSHTTLFHCLAHSKASICLVLQGTMWAHAFFLEPRPVCGSSFPTQFTMILACAMLPHHKDIMIMPNHPELLDQWLICKGRASCLFFSLPCRTIWCRHFVSWDSLFLSDSCLFWVDRNLTTQSRNTNVLY